MLRRVILAGLATCLFVPVIYLSQVSNAQAQTTATSSGDCYIWIDAKTGERVPTVPRGGTGPLGGETSDSDNHRVNPKTGQNFVRVPCPPTDASTTPPIQSGIVPGGGLLPGKDAGGSDTPDKPGGDTKTTDTKTPDTKTTDTKTPATPAKDEKPQQADTPKTGQAEKTITGKDGTPSKTTAEKQIQKGTKKLTGPKNASTHKTTKSAAAKSKEKKAEDKVQVHIEFFSTKSGGGGFNSGGYGR